MGEQEVLPSAHLMVPAGEDVLPLPFELARARLAAARYYWLKTMHPSGRPHTRPVLAVWGRNALYTTSTPSARKSRHLLANPNCSVAVMAEDMHLVLEGTASRVDADAELEWVGEAYRLKYNWPVTVVDGAFAAPCAAPTTGPPPYQPYRVTLSYVYAFVTDDDIGGRHTRWRF